MTQKRKTETETILGEQLQHVATLRCSSCPNVRERGQEELRSRLGALRAQV